MTDRLARRDVSSTLESPRVSIHCFRSLFLRMVCQASCSSSLFYFFLLFFCLLLVSFGPTAVFFALCAMARRHWMQSRRASATSVNARHLAISDNPTPASSSHSLTAFTPRILVFTAICNSESSHSHSASPTQAKWRRAEDQRCDADPPPNNQLYDMSRLAYIHLPIHRALLLHTTSSLHTKSRM